MSRFWKMHDDFVEWEWWNVYPHHPLFEWLLTKAKVQDCRVRGIVVRRGSLVTTYDEMQRAVSNECHKCSRGTLSRALKDLQASGDLTLIADYQKTVVTICHYEIFNGTGEGLWTANGLQTDCKRTATPIINKNKEYKDIYSADEGLDFDDDGIVTENDCRMWMRRYNEIARKYDVADKDLAQQLTDTRKRIIGQCVRLRGRGTVDAMFARLADSYYYFQQGSKGFRGDFTKLWSPKVFDMVLEGSFVPRQQKKEEKPQQQKAKETVEAYEFEARPRQERKAQLEGMVGIVEKTPDSWCRKVLVQAYESGELRQLGIDWKPNIQQSV